MGVRTWRCFRPKMASSRDWLKRLWHRNSGYCEYCNRKTEMPPSGGDREHGVLYASRDHKVPLVLGGRNFEGNYALACQPCNNLKADMDWPDWRSFMAKNPRWWESMPRAPQPAGEVQQARDQVETDVEDAFEPSERKAHLSDLRSVGA